MDDGEKKVQGSGYDHFKVLSQYLTWETEKNQENSENRESNPGLPNMKQEC
jgi:hypothetical protein